MKMASPPNVMNLRAFLAQNVTFARPDSMGRFAHDAANPASNSRAYAARTLSFGCNTLMALRPDEAVG